MNYKFFVPSVVLLALLASCSSKEVLPNPETISVSAITVNPTSITITEGESSTITATISPSNANNKKVIWSSSDASVATVSDGKVSGVAKGTAVITATADDNGKKSQCSVTVNAKPGGGGNGGGGSTFTMAAVDLGLSVKWANANLGAEAIEGYGDYYAWGETQTKNNYSWSTYKWCNGSKTTLTKYNTKSQYGDVDNITTLSADDDVAHNKLGGEWRIPTKTEWNELLTKCEWTETTHNFVKGWLVTAANGNSIFLPYAGRYHNDEIWDRGTHNCYLSSSLDENEPYFMWTFQGKNADLADERCYGLSVRPVSGPASQVTEFTISVSVKSESVCTVTISTNSSATYYVGCTTKSTWDEYGKEYVCDYFIKDDIEQGQLEDYLMSGSHVFDLKGLKTKTEYVVFATFCNTSGVRSGEIYSKTFTTK